MFIIWGSGYYFKSKSVKGFGECRHCSRFSWQKSYDGRKFGHLYYIPLIPMGPWERVVGECSACSLGNMLPQDQVPEDAKRLLESLQQIINNYQLPPEEAAAELEAHPNLDRQAILDRQLLDTIHYLLQLGYAKEIDDELMRMTSNGHHYHVALARAKIQHFAGPNPDVEPLILKAIELAPDPGVAMHFLAKYYESASRFDEAIRTFEHLASQEPVEPWVLWPLVQLYVKQKQWAQAVDAYERTFKLLPDLRADKAVAKEYAKACKKAGRTPQAN